MPPLAGRSGIDDAMIAFKSGQRPATIMNRLAKGFTDDEIRAIAAWYAAQKP
jgi:cytochrome c553